MEAAKGPALIEQKSSFQLWAEKREMLLDSMQIRIAQFCISGTTLIGIGIHDLYLPNEHD